MLKIPAPVLKVIAVKMGVPVMSFVSKVPPVPAAPKTSESPLATGPLPDENVQLAEALKLALVLPNQVSVLAARAGRVKRHTAATAPRVAAEKPPQPADFE